MYSSVFHSKQNMFAPLFSYLCMTALDHVCPGLYNANQAVKSPRSYTKWVSVSTNGSWFLRMITTPGKLPTTTSVVSSYPPLHLGSVKQDSLQIKVF